MKTLKHGVEYTHSIGATTADEHQAFLKAAKAWKLEVHPYSTQPMLQIIINVTDVDFTPKEHVPEFMIGSWRMVYYSDDDKTINISYRANNETLDATVTTIIDRWLEVFGTLPTIKSVVTKLPYTDPGTQADDKTRV